MKPVRYRCLPTNDQDRPDFRLSLRIARVNMKRKPPQMNVQMTIMKTMASTLMVSLLQTPEIGG